MFRLVLPLSITRTTGTEPPTAPPPLALVLPVSLAAQTPLANPPRLIIESRAPINGQDWLCEGDTVHLRWSRAADFSIIGGSGSQLIDAAVIDQGFLPWVAAPLAPDHWHFQLAVTRPDNFRMDWTAALALQIPAP